MWAANSFVARATEDVSDQGLMCPCQPFVKPAPGTPDSGYPLGWEEVRWAPSRMRAAAATLTITARAAQSRRRFASSPIRCACQTRGIGDWGEYR